MHHDEEPTTAADRAAAQPRTARGVLVAVASLLLPGAGQLAVGAWRRGLIMAAVTVLLLIGAWGARPPSQTAIELLTRPGGLTEVLFGNVLLGVFRIYATLDAFRLGSGGLGRSPADKPVTRGAFIAVAALAALALLPHAVVAHYTLVTNSTLGAVFASPEQEGGRSDGATNGASDGAADVAIGERASGDLPSSEEPGRADRPLSWLGDDDRLTVAVLGSDASPGRPGHRLDSLMVVSVHPSTGQAAVFSVERHLRGFPLPDGLQEAWEQRCRDAAPGWDLLNSVYRCGDEVLVDEVAAMYPETSDPAAAAAADTLGIMLGLSVDHYVMVKMAGFVELVDALGGVHLDLPGPRTNEPDRPNAGCDWRAFDVQPESRYLDGEAALELVRNRDGTNEADRMARQRCMLVTLADQVDAPTLLRRFEPLADVLRRNLVTSIPLNEVPALIELLEHVDPREIVTVGFGQPDHVLAGERPHLDRIREDVDAVLDRSVSRTATPRAAR